MKASSVNHSHFIITRNFKHKEHIIFLLLFSAFGPYLSNHLGVRLEHLVIYPLFFVAAIEFLLSPRGWKMPLTVRAVLFFLILATSWTLLVSYLGGSSLSVAKIIAGLENYLQPIALVFVLSQLLTDLNRSEKKELLRRSCFFIIAFLGVNSIIAVAEIFLDTWPFVKYFVREGVGTGISVWKSAVSMGRYCGIFNQPFEAGLAYSIGLASWVYWVSSKKGSFLKKNLFLGALLIGGSLSVSKVFLLGGLPLCFLFGFWNSKLRVLLKPNVFVPGFIFLGLFILLTLWGMEQWSGADFLLRLFRISSRSDDLLSFYSAGRFGSSETGVTYLFRNTLERAPIQGFGFGGFLGALDNGYLEFFVQGGMVGLVLYLFILIGLFYHGVKHFSKAPHECRFLLVLTIIVVGAGLGAPVLTINRSSILLWGLLIPLISISAEPSVKSILGKKTGFTVNCSRIS